MALRALGVCAGIGGLELGLSLACGSRTVGYVERDAFAAAALVAGMENATVDRAPVWDDVATFDGRPWRGAVDIVAAGFPCQPWSTAGKQLGTDDERWLWPDIARIVADVRPGLVFLENVPGLLRRGGLGHVLGDLAALGFDAEWDVFSAAEAGAGHKRERVFVLAHRDGDGCGRLTQRDDGPNDRQQPLGRDAERRHPHVADTRRTGDERLGGPGEPRRSARSAQDGARERERGGDADAHGSERRQDADRGHEPDRDDAGRDEAAGRPRVGSERLADTERGRLGAAERDARPGEPDALGCLPLFPPLPGDADGWARVLAEVPALEPALCRLADGVAFRADWLRACGNAVVPIVAAWAFRTLAERGGWDLMGSEWRLPEVAE